MGTANVSDRAITNPSEIGVINVPPGTISLVQKLFTAFSPDDAEKWEKVEHEIENLDDDAVYHALFLGSQHGWVTSSAELRTPKSGWFFERRKSGERTCVALAQLSSDERRYALTQHLKSFYPVV